MMMLLLAAVHLQACDIFTCMHGTVAQSGVDMSGAPTFECVCEADWTGAE